MRMLLQKSRWLIFAVLVVSFFCLFSSQAEASEPTQLGTLSAYELKAMSPTIMDFEDISVIPATGYWDEYGVKFTSNKGKAIYVNDYNRSGDPTYSGAYSLFNNANWPNTSVNDALQINFYNPVKAVGFYLGNAEPDPINATISVYSSHNDLLGTMVVQVKENPVNTFVGIKSNDSIYAVHIDYGDTYAGEDMDYLMFVPYGVSAATTPDLGMYGFLNIGTDKKQVKWNETITLKPGDALNTSLTNPAFNLYYTEKNYGDGNGDGYRNDITFDGSLVSQQTNRSLDAGLTQEIWTQAYLPVSAGTHTLKFEIDAANEEAESDETNNNFQVYVKFSGFDGEEVEETEILPATNEETVVRPPATTIVEEEAEEEVAEEEVTTPAEAGKLPVDGKGCVALEDGGKRIIAFGDNKVYYAYKGYRHWFPDEATYLSWFSSFAGIEMISQTEMVGYEDGWSVCHNISNVNITEGNETAEEKEMLPATNDAANEVIRTAPITRTEKKVESMSCGDSQGGDGLYSGCKGDTIFHRSKVDVMVRAYDGKKVIFLLDNASKTYARAALGKSVTVDREDGEMSLKLSYTEKSNKYGAFVKIETIFNDAVEAVVEEEVVEEKAMLPATNDAVVRPTETVVEEEEVVLEGSARFNVSVNDYPEHQNYSLSKNLANAYVNMYTMTQNRSGFFMVSDTETKSTGVGRDPVAKFSVEPGEMAYFEGFKSYRGAMSGKVKKESIGWSAPPYKNYNAGFGNLCQTNYADTDNYLDNSCTDNLSTPYQD